MPRQRATPPPPPAAVELVPVDRLRLPNDSTIIPRLRSETYMASEYAAAMRLYGGWGEFPPIVCDQELLVLGGVTRVQAAGIAGVDEVPVRVVECATAADRLLIAAADNAVHGKRWSARDITVIGLTAERVGLPVGELATAMRVKVERIERLPLTTVVRRGAGGEPVEERVYAKRAARHAVRGRVLSEEEELMRRLSTPNQADQILLDLIRLGQLEAFPPLTPEAAQNLLAVQELLAGWYERDRHLLEAA